MGDAVPEVSRNRVSSWPLRIALLISAVLVVAVFLFRVANPRMELTSQEFLRLYVPMEVIRIGICIGIFTVLWINRKFELTQQTLIIGCAFLAAGLLFLLRLIVNLEQIQGMAAEASQQSLYFRSFARWTIVIFMLIAVFVPYKLAARGRILNIVATASVAYVAVVAFLVFYEIDSLPVLFEPGVGMTVFAQGLAACAIVLCLFLAYKFNRIAKSENDSSFSLLAAALATSVPTEFAFALVKTENDVFKFIGNVLGAAGFVLIFFALTRSSLITPYQRLEEARRVIEADRKTLERKSVELRESELKFATFMKHSPAITYMKDREGRLLFVNETFERVFGSKLSDLQGKKDNEIWPVETSATIRKMDIDVLDSQKAIGSYEEIPRPDGIQEWFTVRFPIPDADGNPNMLGGFGIDVTELRKIERALVESEEKFKALFNSAGDGIVIVEPKSGSLTSANKRMCDMLGYTEEEMRKLMITGPAPGFVLAEEKEQFNRVLLRGETDRATNIPMKRKDGRVIYADIMAFKVTAGGQQHTAGIFRDVTERRLFEEQRKVAIFRLTNANRDLTQFAYVSSHDLQEPLRMISSYLQLLSKRYSGQLDKEADEFIQYAVDGALRLQKMINDLLAFSRIGTRGKPFELIDCNLVLDYALSNLSIAIEESGATVIRDKLPAVEADESQLVQLFQNLLENAIKFRSDQPPRVHVSAERGDGEWLFSVKDNSIGIDPLYHDKMFVIFQRLHSAAKYTGTGIGLAICKRIVERHSGRIWVESELGKGSTFRFTIPDKKEEPAAGSLEAEIISPDQEKKKT